MPLNIKKTTIQTKGRKEFNYGSEKDTYVGSSQLTILSGASSYYPGENIQISADGVISATDTKYTAGHNIEITSGNVINALAEQYYAGDNINISSGNVISTSANVHSDYVRNIVVCSQSAYDSMAHDGMTLYLIVADYINVSPLSFSIDYSGGTGTITITSNSNWTIEVI